MTKRSYRDDVQAVLAHSPSVRRHSDLFCTGAYFDRRRWLVRPAGLQPRGDRPTATLSNDGRPRLSMQVREADTGAARRPCTATSTSGNVRCRPA